MNIVAEAPVQPVSSLTPEQEVMPISAVQSVPTLHGVKAIIPVAAVQGITEIPRTIAQHIIAEPSDESAPPSRFAIVEHIITPLDVQGVGGELSRHLSPKSVRERYRLMKAVMAAAVESRMIAEFPCRGVTLPRIPRQEQRFLSPAEIRRLDDEMDPSLEAIVYAASYLGARWGELSGLKRENLNLLRREGSYRRGAPRGRREASLYARDQEPGQLPELVHTPIPGGSSRDTWRLLQPPSTSSPPPRQAPIPLELPGKLLAARGGHAGLAPLKFHSLRHTHAGLLIAGGLIQGRPGPARP